MKTASTIVFSFLLTTFCFAQHDFYMGAQTESGIMTSPKFDNAILKTKTYSPQIGGLFSVHYRYFDMFAIEAGIGQHFTNSRFKDPTFESENPGFNVKFNNKNFHWNYYAALSSMLRIGRTKTYLYGKVGYSININGAQTLTKIKEFIIADQAIDKTFTATTNYNKSNYSIIPEIGVQKKIYNRNLISAGIKMNMGQTPIMNGTYSITNNTTKEIVSDNITSMGDFISLNVRYDLLLHHISKKEKAKKEKKEKEKVPVVVQKPKDKPKETPKIEPDEKPAKVEDRQLIVTHKIKVHSPKITVYVWDHQSVDGDRISVKLNDEWVLEDLTLKKEKYSFEVELREGKNIFVLHALNLGKFKPNTCAIMVMDGHKVQQIILESNMNESGTLEINYKGK